jgi:small subunit ribosomal protein S6
MRLWTTISGRGEPLITFSESIGPAPRPERVSDVRHAALLIRGARRTLAPPATETPWPPSPKEVETALRAYEVMVILDPDLEERTVAPSLDTYLNVVRVDGGSIENVDVWGRRRLAYEIDKKTEGIYAVVKLSAEPATVKELDRQLTLNESVMRTKVMRPDAH